MKLCDDKIFLIKQHIWVTEYVAVLQLMEIIENEENNERRRKEKEKLKRNRREKWLETCKKI